MLRIQMHIILRVIFGVKVWSWGRKAKLLTCERAWLIYDSSPEYSNSEKLCRVFLCCPLVGCEHSCRRVLKTVSGKHCWSAPHNSEENSWNRRPVTCRSLQRFVQKLGRCSYFVFLAGDFSRAPFPSLSSFFVRSSPVASIPDIPRHFFHSDRESTELRDLVDLRLINFRDLTFFSYFREVSLHRLWHGCFSNAWKR